MEYWKGVQRADTEVRRRARLSFFEEAFGDLTVLPLDGATARTGARIWADLEAAGNLIPALDLLIAATAVEHGLSLATADVRDFKRVQGMQVIELGT
jgi:predicted nucleic acid-binding protein